MKSAIVESNSAWAGGQFVARWPFERPEDFDLSSRPGSRSPRTSTATLRKPN